MKKINWVRPASALKSYATFLLLFLAGVFSVRAQAPVDTSSIEYKNVYRFSVEDALKLPPEASEPVVFTASRQAQRLSDAPATILIVTAEEIQTRGYQTLLEVLGDLPEYKIDQYGTSRLQFDYVNVRGLPGQEKFLILMDGVRISSYTNEASPLLQNIPIQNVKQIEIVTSAASALYGADALSGVINIISYKPEEANTIKGGVQAGLYNQLGANFFLAKSVKGVGFRLNSTFNYDGQPNFSKFYPDKYKGIEDQKTGLFNSSFGPIQTTLPLKSDVSMPIYAYNVEGALTYQNLTFSFYRGYTRTPSSNTYLASNAVYNDDVFLAQAFMRGTAVYAKNFNRLSNTTTIVFSQYDLAPESSYRNLYSGFNYGYKYGHSHSWFAEQQNGYEFSKRFSVSGGISLLSAFSSPKGADLDKPVDPSGTLDAYIAGTPFKADFFVTQYYSLGAYIQALYKPHPRVSLTAGGRWDYNTRFDPVFNPRVGVSYNAKSNTLFKLFYGSAFLAVPPWLELDNYGSFFTPDSGKTWQSFFYHLPNPDLKPIRVQTFEGNVRQKLNNLTLSLTAYYVRAYDLIDYGSDAATGNRYNGTYKGWPVAFIEVFTNVGTIQSYGGSFTARYDKTFRKGNKLSITGATAFIGGQKEEADGDKVNELPLTATMQYRGIIDLYLRKWTFSLRGIGMSAQRSGKIDDEKAGDGKEKYKTIPGYFVMHANIGYQVLPQLRLFVNLQNITDRRYLNMTELAFDGISHNGMAQNPFRFILGVNFTIK